MTSLLARFLGRSCWFVGLGLAACGGEEPTAVTSASPTYHGDVQPILDARCTTCHAEGGIAPFALTTYAEVAPFAALIEEAVRARTMPPWLASSDHDALKYDETLSDAQIATIRAWVDAGAPEGDASRPGKPLDVTRGGLSRVDVTLAMPEAYTPQLFPDDYRCFVLDWPLDEARYVTGFNSVPGNDAIVHHTLAFLVSPDYVPLVEGFDAAEEGPGYGCFGGPTAEGAAQFPVAFMGAWAPGMGGVDLPASTGILVEPGSKVVLQLHYSGTTPATLPDATAMQFSIAEQVTTEGFYVPFFDIQWYVNPESMPVPAGVADVKHSFQDDPSTNVTVLSLTRGKTFPNGMTIHSTLLHQHLLGKSIALSKSANGENDTLIEIPDWDFHWQREYFFETPPVVLPGEELYLECHWDNSAAGQPPTDGVQQPQDVTWGEGTQQEMCLSFLYVTAL